MSVPAAALHVHGSGSRAAVPPLPGAGPSWTGAQRPPALEVAGSTRPSRSPGSSSAASRPGVPRGRPSLGGPVAHTLQAGRQERLDRVVVDGGGSCQAGGAGVAAVSPSSTGTGDQPCSPKWSGWLPQAGTGSQRTCTPSPRAGFRRALADGNDARISSQEVSAPLPDPAGGGRAEGNGRASLQRRAGRPDAQRRRQVRSRRWPRLAGRPTRAALSDGEGLDRRAGGPGRALTETTAWSRVKLAGLLGRPVSELDGPSPPG